MSLLWLNVYRAGHYHRQGKPNATNLHAGDLYPTHDAAREAAEEDKGYLFTVAVNVPIPNGMQVAVNGPDSAPTPLAETISNPDRCAPWAVAKGTAALPEATSLEAGDDVLGMSYEEWRREREKTGFAPQPEAHKPVAALLRSRIGLPDYSAV